MRGLILVDSQDGDLVKKPLKLYSRSHAGFISRKVLLRKLGVSISLVMCDHRDNNPFNARRRNLRPATQRQNNHNRSKQEHTSQFKGVSWYGNNPCWKGKQACWRAQVKHQGRKIHLGYFDSALEAARAYDRAALKYFGSFAHPNFPRKAA